jgi:TusA-related sulfurtransferase
MRPPSKAASAAAAMTTPAQLERLGEHLRKLRLLKSGERLEALLQDAAANDMPYAEFLEQVLGEEVAAKASKKGVSVFLWARRLMTLSSSVRRERV